MTKGVNAYSKHSGVDERYFSWLVSKVSERGDFNYSRLLRFLHSVPFTYILARDKNRAIDGEALRHSFSIENHDDIPLKGEPCSVLEMMIGLAIRCERHIMNDPDCGDRTGVWFYDMICALGVEDMRDDSFDTNRVQQIIDRFLQREFYADGTGSLFIVKDSGKDLRDVEIWYAAMMYLNTQITWK